MRGSGDPAGDDAGDDAAADVLGVLGDRVRVRLTHDFAHELVEKLAQLAPLPVPTWARQRMVASLTGGEATVTGLMETAPHDVGEHEFVAHRLDDWKALQR